MSFPAVDAFAVFGLLGPALLLVGLAQAWRASRWTIAARIRCVVGLTFCTCAAWLWAH